MVKRSRISPLLVTLTLLLSPAIAVSQNMSSGSSSPSGVAHSNLAPDNSGVNVRDRSGRTVTPFSQSSKQSDIETTRKIRRALMNDKSLSTTARNIKVITRAGTVTLRGPVESEQEKAAVADRAQQIAGSGHVDDQLEIAGR